jgi:hypothetical protein
MNNSLKVGIISGVITGIVWGIVVEIFQNIRVMMNIYDPWIRPLLTDNIPINIPLFGFWGIVLGIIFSRVYEVIPRKGIWKGVIYGLILYVIITIRIEFFSIAYGYYLTAFGDVFFYFFGWVFYGVVLSFLYELLLNKYHIVKEKRETIQYDLRSGIFPGAISGFISGFAVSIFAVLGHVTGLYGVFVTSKGQVVSTFDIWISQMGSHIFINMFWGAIFGAIFACVYNFVPGERIKKGLFYGLLLLLITTFQIGTWLICWAAYHNVWMIVYNQLFSSIFLGIIQFGIFGLVLGYIYNK